MKSDMALGFRNAGFEAGPRFLPVVRALVVSVTILDVEVISIVVDFVFIHGGRWPCFLNPLMQAGVAFGFLDAGKKACLCFQPVVRFSARNAAALDIQMIGVVADVMFVYRFAGNAGRRGLGCHVFVYSLVSLLFSDAGMAVVIR